MNDLHTLDQILSEDYLDDYWADEMLSIVGGHVSALRDVDFDFLLMLSHERSLLWRIRLAEVLRFTISPAGLECLYAMMNTETEELFITCADSVATVSHIKVSIPASVIEFAQNMLDSTKSSINKLVLQNFLNRTCIDGGV
jgi:hypothetical protein